MSLLHINALWYCIRRGSARVLLVNWLFLCFNLRLNKFEIVKLLDFTTKQVLWKFQILFSEKFPNIGYLNYVKGEQLCS